jgi:ABC-type branched-subunit amino acid transport system ATPase component
MFFYREGVWVAQLVCIFLTHNLQKFAQNVLSLYTGNWDLYYSVTTTHLQADMSILDEIDSGLDIDALREVATAVNGLRTEKTATLMVTHYQVSAAAGEADIEC